MGHRHLVVGCIENRVSQPSFEIRVVAELLEQLCVIRQQGDETVTRFKPEPYHTSVPGYAYGGLIASLIDCHCTGTASAAMYKQEGRCHDSLPAFRFVTGSLHVDFLKPTPLEGELVIRGRVKEIKGRKVVVEATVYAGDVATARGEVVAIQMPESFGA